MRLSSIIGEVEIECPRCGHNKSYKRLMNDNSAEFGECMKCGKMTYHKIIDGIDFSQPVTVKCPYCNSTNTKKISTLSKAADFALFGVFAVGKTTKQWHCNNCKSDF